jgi:hypothetical protein
MKVVATALKEHGAYAPEVGAATLIPFSSELRRSSTQRRTLWMTTVLCDLREVALLSQAFRPLQKAQQGAAPVLNSDSLRIPLMSLSSLPRTISYGKKDSSRFNTILCCG